MKKIKKLKTLLPLIGLTSLIIFTPSLVISCSSVHQKPSNPDEIIPEPSKPLYRFTYKDLKEGGIEIVGIYHDNENVKAITIPEKIDGKIVKSIDLAEKAYFPRIEDAEVYFENPSAIEFINFSLFDLSNFEFDFSKFTSLKVIDSSCFSGGLKNSTIDLSNTKVDFIGSWAFSGCVNLTKVIWPKYSNTNTPLAIGNYAFENTNISNESVNNLNNVKLKYIGNYAFKNCQDIKVIDWQNIDLPEFLIYNSIFSGCKQLTTIKVQDKANRWSLSSFVDRSEENEWNDPYIIGYKVKVWVKKYM